MLCACVFLCMSAWMHTCHHHFFWFCFVLLFVSWSVCSIDSSWLVVGRPVTTERRSLADGSVTWRILIPEGDVVVSGCECGQELSALLLRSGRILVIDVCTWGSPSFFFCVFPPPLPLCSVHPTLTGGCNVHCIFCGLSPPQHKEGKIQHQFSLDEPGTLLILMRATEGFVAAGSEKGCCHLWSLKEGTKVRQHAAVIGLAPSHALHRSPPPSPLLDLECPWW